MFCICLQSIYGSNENKGDVASGTDLMSCNFTSHCSDVLVGFLLEIFSALCLSPAHVNRWHSLLRQVTWVDVLCYVDTVKAF